MQPAPFISLENITVRLQDRPYLHNTSWQINSNENWAVLGPNGSGKTTLARSILGEVPIIKGKITYHFFGGDRQNRAAVANAIGYVSPELHRDIVKRENLQNRFREFSGKTHEFTSVKELILNGKGAATTEIHHDNPLCAVSKKIGIETLLERDITSLSTGEMNTALIARALLGKPQLLILDEPFDGLDKSSRRSLADIINALARADIQLILITHRFEEIVPNVTHVLLLKRGQIFRAGRKEAVFSPQIIDDVYEMGDRSIQPNPQNLITVLPRRKEKRRRPAQNKTGEDPRVLIEMKNVTVQYGTKLILDGFSWIVKEGQNWEILGPSAAGKSTVLALIHGDNLQAYANEIYLFGQKRGAGQSLWDIRQKIGYISSDLQLRQHRHIEAFKVVCSGFFASNGLYRRCSSDQLALAGAWTRFLDVSHLDAQKFGRLSHGQRQLILLARAMVKSPAFLFLDEPFLGLDIKNKSKLRTVFEYIGRHTPTHLIYVPDQAEETLNCITHVLQMARGKVIGARALGN